MKTNREWLAMRKGLWLNDNSAVVGMSQPDPLPKNSAVNKGLALGAKPLPSDVPVLVA